MAITKIGRQICTAAADQKENCAKARGRIAGTVEGKRNDGRLVERDATHKGRDGPEFELVREQSHVIQADLKTIVIAQPLITLLPLLFPFSPFHIYSHLTSHSFNPILL